ncbi:type I glutamate--ammonia ligase [Caldisalinibacter kiritimatiensis]|uniref:Glutamine synthetase n=1 Tax=Caldisalinibacter kiritimatiensis TaxID=1304284 RepID=R1CSW3_9FIRM|nr:type I glutamate--ammonia ligase [Caldisalinibacter kiritimatiensis]EOC99793.1 Glutamine synthetase type I [Caldisalinibacter kiritimatiensis]
MFNNVKEVKEFCENKKIKIIDFKVVDLAGRWHHLSIPAERFNESIIENGIGFDGSSYGFLTVEKSDMIFKPDITTAFIDPFCQIPTLTMIANIYETDGENKRFEGDPRYIAEKAESYLIETGIADENIIGPEFEFYVFDHVAYNNKPYHQQVSLDTRQAYWNTGINDYQNLGYKVQFQKGYHVDIPKDITNDFRSKATRLLEDVGIKIKYHHHEVGGAGQVELETQFGRLKEMADNTLKLKYIVKNLAIQEGKTVTFMPKPIYGEAGNGMHIHMQLFKDGQPIFYDQDGYSQLSDIALYYIGGILKHAPALLAFTNPSTNSYKRLVPGYEAPVSICFATANRSSVIRIPGYAKTPEKKRFEFRPSDATANPYLAFAAILMAGLDGVINKIDPAEQGFGPYDINIFNLPEEERSKIKSLPKSLEEAADALEKDHEFLLAGGVFTKGLIQDQISRIREEARKVNNVPHPKEFELYYDL